MYPCFCNDKIGDIDAINPDGFGYVDNGVRKPFITSRNGGVKLYDSD